MNKTLLLSTILLSSISAFSQNDRSKKVETSYLSLPGYDMSLIDPSTITIEFSMKDAVFGVERLKEGESACIPKGGSIKDAVKVKAYHYEIPYTQPESYVVAKSSNGTVVYAAQSSVNNPSVVRFGWDEKMKQALCEYALSSDKLKKEYASNGTSFKTSQHKAYESEIYNNARTEAIDNTSLSYFPEQFEVFSAKGKVYNYEELDAAFENAISAYTSLKKIGFNLNDLKKLKGSVDVWEKELISLDTEDKNARISEDIGKGLHENCARAYYYLYDFDQAKKHAEAFKAFFGNFSNNRTQAIDKLLLNIHLQKVAAEKNSKLIEDITALHAKASQSKSEGNSRLLSSADFERLQSEFYLFKGTQASGLMAEKKKEEEQAIADGTLNPYQKYYYPTAVGGEGILMTMPPSTLSGVPELSSFPVEICAFTAAKQVVIVKNKIASIPPEIGNMIALQKLDLSGNQLTTLPIEIGLLSELETLKLNDNPITNLPMELGECTKLTSLQIKGCKLTQGQIDEIQKLLPNCKIKL